MYNVRAVVVQASHVVTYDQLCYLVAIEIHLGLPSVHVLDGIRHTWRREREEGEGERREQWKRREIRSNGC